MGWEKIFFLANPSISEKRAQSSVPLLTMKFVIL